MDGSAFTGNSFQPVTHCSHHDTTTAPGTTVALLVPTHRRVHLEYEEDDRHVDHRRRRCDGCRNIRIHKGQREREANCAELRAARSGSSKAPGLQAWEYAVHSILRVCQ